MPEHPFNWFNFYSFWEPGPHAAPQPAARTAAANSSTPWPLAAQPSPLDELMRRHGRSPGRRATFVEEKTLGAL